jgi:hypothetical protein
VPIGMERAGCSTSLEVEQPRATWRLRLNSAPGSPAGLTGARFTVRRGTSGAVNRYVEGAIIAAFITMIRIQIPDAVNPR